MALGVTVMVAVMAVVVLLAAVNPGVFPLPLPARPMAVLLLLHVKEAPAVALVKVAAAMGVPLHTVILAGTVTVGVGFTVMV